KTSIEERHDYQVIGLRKWQRFKNNSLQYAEDSCIGADAQRQSRDRRRCHCRASAQRTECISEIPKKPEERLHAAMIPASWEKVRITRRHSELGDARSNWRKTRDHEKWSPRG